MRTPRRPAWDSTQHDLSVYRLSPEEQHRKKQQVRSKNLAVARDEYMRKMQRLEGADYDTDGGSDAGLDDEREHKHGKLDQEFLQLTSAAQLDPADIGSPSLFQLAAHRKSQASAAANRVVVEPAVTAPPAGLVDGDGADSSMLLPADRASVDVFDFENINVDSMLAELKQELRAEYIDPTDPVDAAPVPQPALALAEADFESEVRQFEGRAPLQQARQNEQQARRVPVKQRKAKKSASPSPAPAQRKKEVPAQPAAAKAVPDQPQLDVPSLLELLSTFASRLDKAEAELAEERAQRMVLTDRVTLCGSRIDTAKEDNTAVREATVELEGKVAQLAQLAAEQEAKIAQLEARLSRPVVAQGVQVEIAEPPAAQEPAPSPAASSEASPAPHHVLYRSPRYVQQQVVHAADDSDAEPPVPRPLTQVVVGRGLAASPQALAANPDGAYRTRPVVARKPRSPQDVIAQIRALPRPSPRLSVGQPQSRVPMSVAK